MTELTVQIKPAEVVECVHCGQAVLTVQMIDGSRLAVQPQPVQPVVPARPKIIISGPTPPQEALRKLAEHTWEATLGAPVYIPHDLVCPKRLKTTAALLLGLSIPRRPANEPRHRPKGPVRGAAQPQPEAEAEARSELQRALESEFPRPIDGGSGREGGP